QAVAKADAKGAWAVELPALKKGENLELTVTGKNVITLKNVIVGDIWLCSGQSNMELPLNQCLGSDGDIGVDYPGIRLIKINHEVSAYPEQEAPVAGAWQVCTKWAPNGYTGVGFYFTREIHKQTGVPVGLIDASWRGAAIEPWITLEALQSMPEFREAAVARSTNFVTNSVMTGWCNMQNAMISPLFRFPIKGVLWYQGESNGNEGETYYHKMRALVNGWRKAWNRLPPQGAGASVGEFPFYFVQLTGYGSTNPNDHTNNPAGGDGWSRLREAQTQALAITNSGMAVIIDTQPINEANDYHPRNKYDVGMRLARWALNRDYGMKDVVPSGPLFKSMAIEGDKVRLAFDYTGSGLMVGAKVGRAPAVEDKAGKLKRFAIAGADKKWVWADAVIDGQTVVVSSPEVKAPVAVRYAFSMYPYGANLYNREGLPASPFRTDAW
ncbi:MAG: sialate O-acetylesterase, partial [Alphaproteobacteria bacterium]